ncbi:uncharacterized protein LOC136094761 [Hydra vulgaris]|uniref:uncharacterized protein LOC136094761 n=1 Tax=Hydra vulgaris TaxID=6087 RepID=UPI0032E9FD50
MSQEDVDSLAQLTNYHCGYVMLMQTKNVVPVPDISNIAQEIEVHTSLQPFLPKTSFEIVTYFDCKILYKFLLRQLAINFDEISLLEHLTRKQSCNNNWHKHRKGRVTASKVYNVVHRVNNELEIICPEKLTSIIIGVLSKSKFFQTKATSWGLRHEKDVLKAYWKENKKKHRFMKMTECGLFVNKDLPIVGASPDSLVHCDCCSTGCVEVKCP